MIISKITQISHFMIKNWLTTRKRCAILTASAVHMTLNLQRGKSQRSKLKSLILDLPLFLFFIEIIQGKNKFHRVYLNQKNVRWQEIVEESQMFLKNYEACELPYQIVGAVHRTKKQS